MLGLGLVAQELRKAWARLGGAGLTVLSACYIVGFLSWAMYARLNDMGPLPVTTVQYLAAGVPAVFLALVLLGQEHFLRFLHDRLRDGWTGKVLRFALPLGLRPLLAGACFWVLAFLGAILAYYRYDQVRLSQMFLSGFAFGLLMSLAILLLIDLPVATGHEWTRLRLGRQAETAAAQTRLDRFAGHARKWTTLAAWPLIVLFLSGFLLLPNINPEFGGALPQHAIVDLEVEGLSPQVRTMLLESAPVPSNATVQAVQVTVFFRASDYLLVCPGRVHDALTCPYGLYELRMDAVRAIKWEPSR